MKLIKQVRVPCNTLEEELRRRNIAFEREDTIEQTRFTYTATDGRKIVAVIDNVLPIDCDAYTELISYYEV
jgi:hypothetical protein